MASELEITKRNFYSDSHSYAKNEKIAIEDSQFMTFVNFLDESDIINTPVLSRAKDKFKTRDTSLLGYCCSSYFINNEENIEEEIIEDTYVDPNENSSEGIFNNRQPQWEFIIFNGFFSSKPDVTYATKQSINKSISEATAFLEKTFSNNLINDFSEARNLQEHLIQVNSDKSLDRIDIYIVTDSVIDQVDLPTIVELKKFDLKCRIYYWDLKKWNDLKRSKSKRLPIDIDFQDVDYKTYDIQFIEKKATNKLSYFLSIFPAKLISDIYDYNKTSVLENNVRVFLSTKRTANKAIRDTIKDDPVKFFSYNNGISATAESVNISNGKITKICDFQIVNGGQTAATIHYTNRKERISLENIYVAVKITALKKDENYSQVVSKISLAANTQTAISKSDLYANDQYLIKIEQFSSKNPTRNELDRNVYFFFERMKGQYSVAKSTSGNARQQLIWEDRHPRVFMFNKIDVARWYNMMNELPFVAATGAEKQFEEFMENSNFQKKEMSLGSYKTLIGFGLLFSRIYKLCGKANGRSYPSLTLDPITGKHSPVAMSTAIYSMTYLHMITKGCIDYWAFFDYKHGLCNSLLSKERIDSSIDKILEKLIKECWLSIYEYGGSASQEQSKKKSCWEHVKSKINIANEVISDLKKYLISIDEVDRRESIVSENENEIYFNSLQILLQNNSSNLILLSKYSETKLEYLKERQTINNHLKKINLASQIWTKKKVNDIISYYYKLRSEGFIFDNVNDSPIEINISFQNIYDYFFKKSEKNKSKFDQSTLTDYNQFGVNNSLNTEIEEIIEKLDREYGLSFEDFIKLDNAYKYFNKN